MKQSKTEIMLDKLKAGETVICPKCQKGIIIYQQSPDRYFPDVFCNNKECNVKITYN